MRFKNLFISIFLFMVGCISVQEGKTPLPPPTHQNQDELTNRVYDERLSIVGILDEEFTSYCTGEFISPNRVITAAHCIDGETALIGLFEDYDNDAYAFVRGYRGTVLRKNAVQDLALIGFSIDFEKRGIPLGDEPEFGDEAYAIGFPAGLAWNLTRGVISYPKRVAPDGQVYTTYDGGIFFGNSGGALLNERGELIGVCSFLVGTSTIGGFTHVDEIRGFVNESQ